MKFALKKKPVKPVRKLLTHNIDLQSAFNWGEIRLDKLNEFVAEKGIEPNQAYITIESDYDSSSISLEYKALEDEAQFKAKMADYEVKIAAWNKWYKANRELIDAETQLREKLKQEKKLQKAKLEESALAKRLAEVRKKLEET